MAEKEYIAPDTLDLKPWQEKLASFIGHVGGQAILFFMHLIGKALKPLVLPQLREWFADADTPTYFKNVLNRSIHEDGEWQGLLFGAMGGSAIGGVTNASMGPWLEILKQKKAKRFPYQILDPISVMTALRRDPEKYTTLLEDLKKGGWHDYQIEAIKFVTEFYPGPADLVNWLAKEVYEPDMIDRYGLDDEAPLDQVGLFEKAGVNLEQMTNYWRAHWEHASFGQVVEMLHRGVLSLDKTLPEPPTTRDGWAKRDEEGVKAIYDWYRLVEIPPFWRDRLTAMTWNVPTRVDVRRFWDMRTIDEARLYSIYHELGYHGKDLDDYVLWTKVYTAWPDLMARYANGYIGLEDVKSELTRIGVPADRVQELLETKVKASQMDRTANERDLTKTDIVKGVKQGVITRDQGVDLLMDLGYSEDESVYILEINIPQDEEDETVKDRELTKTDILNGLKTGVLTEDEALERLLGLRYREDDAQTILDVYKASIKPPEEPKAREASKADIILAVKNGLITPENAYLMLQDIGFTPEASEFILAVRAETSPFSPTTPEEFKDLTSKYRRAIGMTTKTPDEEIKTAGERLVIATRELATLKTALEKTLADVTDESILPAKDKKEINELRVMINRAESERLRLKQELDTLKAKHKYSQ